MKRIILSAFSVTVLGAVILVVLNFQLHRSLGEVRVENLELKTNLEESRASHASTTATLSAIISTLEENLGITLVDNFEKDKQIKGTVTLLESVQASLQTTEYEKAKLAEDLKNEEAKIGILSEQVSSITDVVGQINKIATTDKELLHKYSKVYFLNEHYVPENLLLIEDKYKYNVEERYWFHREAYPHLKKMLDDAQAAGNSISVISAYRSFWAQGVLKKVYTVQYGEGANTFSADQGYSEHQLGTTIDFTEDSIGTTYEGFEQTLSYVWLLTNAHKYGFVQSYPPDNTYYVFEPWHWRFVGAALATKLRNEGKYFYDEEQRVLSSYLGTIFDPLAE